MSACLLFPEKENQEQLFIALPRFRCSHFEMPCPPPRHLILPFFRTMVEPLVSWLGEVLWRGDSSRVQTAAKTCNFVCMGKVSWAEAVVWVLLQSNCSRRTGGRPAAACSHWCGLSWRLSHPPRLWSLHPWGISPISDGKSWVCKL